MGLLLLFLIVEMGVPQHGNKRAFKAAKIQQKRGGGTGTEKIGYN
jgi:hypothetical protein